MRGKHLHALNKQNEVVLNGDGRIGRGEALHLF